MKRRIMLRQKIAPVNEDKLHYYAGYIAGLIDGEGSIMIRLNKRSRTPNFSCFMSIGMTNEGVIKWLANILGVTYSARRQKKGKTMYNLRVFTEDSLKPVLQAMLPWLIVKKEQAETMLKFLNLKPERNQSFRHRKGTPYYTQQTLNLSTRKVER